MEPTRRVLGDDPITFKPITIPVQVPCCKQLFQEGDKEGLDGWLADHTCCPMCSIGNLKKEQLITADKIEGLAKEQIQAAEPSKYVKTPCCNQTVERSFIVEYLENNQHKCPIDDKLLWEDELMPADLPPVKSEEAKPEVVPEKTPEVTATPPHPLLRKKKETPSKMESLWNLFCK